ncbi:MAG TPA: UDP-N-acetylmuramoyl-L-alanine--D-glutamate ligase [Anaerolineae bacterium]|nr:UDP-N-acetylmuramoyl-L-alanine--D-glutamate ligase [Anaerolineae bacterium]
MNFVNKRATIIGLGREGTALARFLARRGAVVTVSDLKPAEELRERIAALGGLSIRFVLGGHPSEILDDADVVFVSPGVRPEAPILVEARRRGLPLSSATMLFFELCPAPIIGVTGSSGKTTTVTLVGEMLKASSFRTWVGGNIGQPLIEQVEEMAPRDWVVMELSSFQLEPMRRSPHIAAFLNLTPDHLDRHLSFEAYRAAKLPILRYQGSDDLALLGHDDPSTRALRSECRGRVLFFSQRAEPEEGAFLRNDEIFVRFEGREERVCPLDRVRLRGRHNLDNVLAASALARAAGASFDAMAEVIASFEGVEHRLELVRELDGVRYVNDSIATSPRRAMAALESFEEPIVLLAGGRHKNLPLEGLVRLIRQKVRHLVLFGEAALVLEAAVKDGREPRPPIHRCHTLEEAVEVAARVAQPGDVVLLSPACTSFDAFRDFAERGARFKELVKSL